MNRKQYIYEVDKIIFHNISGEEDSERKTIIIIIIHVYVYKHSSQYYQQIPSALLYLFALLEVQMLCF
jgi:hypothetical protein